MALKEIIGQVTSNKMDKTVVVAVKSRIQHKRYSKVVSKIKKYYAHDENNTYKNGDIVKIQQSRPISKIKCWKVIESIK